MTKIPIAIQLHSIREYVEKDFKGTMQKVKAMGYDGVELAGLYGYTAVEIKDILDEVGLELISAHVPVSELEKEEVLDDYAMTGIKFLAIPWMKFANNTEGVCKGVETVRMLAEKCKARGMQLLYHNHDFEFEKVDGAYILDTYYAEVPAELLQTELDTCWVLIGGEEPVKYIEKYMGRIPILHLKDLVGNQRKNSQTFEFRPVGYGRQNIPAIIEAAEKAGIQWLVVEQDKPSMNKTALENAEMSLRYLKS